MGQQGGGQGEGGQRREREGRRERGEVKLGGGRGTSRKKARKSGRVERSGEGGSTPGTGDPLQGLGILNTYNTTRGCFAHLHASLG